MSSRAAATMYTQYVQDGVTLFFATNNAESVEFELFEEFICLGKIYGPRSSVIVLCTFLPTGQNCINISPNLFRTT